MKRKRLLLFNFNKDFFDLAQSNTPLMIEGKFNNEGLIESHGAEFRVLNDPSFFTNENVIIVKIENEYYLLEDEEEIRKAKESIKFFEQYKIPFPYSSSRKFLTKRRISQDDSLVSDGTYHLYVEKSFVDGRVKRNANTFLCSTYTDTDSSDKDKVFNSSNHFLSPISCKRCLKLMERWKVNK